MSFWDGAGFWPFWLRLRRAEVYADRDRPASGHGLAEACAKSKLRPCQRIVDKFRRILLLCRITIGRFQG